MSKVNVFITIDTEHSIGGAFNDPSLKPVGNDKRIYGRIGAKEYGIPLIMDIADRYSLPLTFFVEVLNKYYFGENETQEICHYILNRGHDVQLHLHPNYLNFKEENPSQRLYKDNLSGYGLAIQKEMIREGKELLDRYCSRPPVAFRAGNYGADRSTLTALKENGILIDSSYNAAFPVHSKRICTQTLNDLMQIDSTWELPITNFVENIPLRQKRFRPLDINGVSYQEMRTVLDAARKNEGPANVTIILHSFSFVKAHDVQYRRCGVRDYVVKRFENLCRFLRDNQKDFHCWQLVEFANTGFDGPVTEIKNVFPRVGTQYSVIRSIEQKVCEMLT